MIECRMALATCLTKTLIPMPVICLGLEILLAKVIKIIIWNTKEEDQIKVAIFSMLVTAFLLVKANNALVLWQEPKCASKIHVVKLVFK